MACSTVWNRLYSSAIAATLGSRLWHDTFHRKRRSEDRWHRFFLEGATIRIVGPNLTHVAGFEVLTVRPQSHERQLPWRTRAIVPEIPFQVALPSRQ